MMTQEELRTGDWVWFITNKIPCRITEIYTTLDGSAKKMVSLSSNAGERYCVEMSEIEPIRLTPEILGQNGFETSDFNSPWITCWRAYGENGDDDIEVEFHNDTGAIHIKLDVVGTYLSTTMIETVNGLQHVFADHHINVKLTVTKR